MNAPHLLGRWRTGVAVVGAVALVATAAGAALDPRAFDAAWLFAWRFWLGVALGSLGLLMVQHLSGGMWGFLTRRPFEAALRTLPLLALFAVPVLVRVRQVYPWAASAVDDARLAHRAPYLNVPFFVVRTVIYFACWMIMARWLDGWSREQDEARDPAPGLRARALSGPGVVLLAFTVTFASVDWLMSLEPRWYSTIYGFTWLTGDALSALALAVIAVYAMAQRDAEVAALADAQQFRRLGNLLLTAVVLWTYMQFSQFLITWAGNLPNELTWYFHHARGGWQWLAALLAVLHFGAPFALLLFRGNKDRPSRLALIAGGLLVMRVLGTYWMVVPAFRPGAFSVTWLDPVAFAGIGGLWLALFDRELGRRSALPLADPRFAVTAADTLPGRRPS